MKVLITAGKSAQAAKILKAFSNDSILLADYGDVPAFFSESYKFVSLGERNDEVIAHTLLSSCLDLEANAILPIHEFEVVAVSRASILFEEFNVHVLLPEAAKTPQYLNPSLQKGELALFSEGRLLYSSQANLALEKIGEVEKLTGAYYFNVLGDEVELSLIAVYD